MKDEILKILEQQGLLSDDRKKVVEQKVKDGILVDEALDAFQIPLEKVADIKSQLFNLPRWVGSEPSKEVLAKITEESSRHYKMIFLEEAADHLSMGILDPEINGLKDAVIFLSKVAGNKPYKLFILSLTQFNDYIYLYSGKKITKINSTEVSDEIDANKVVEIKFTGTDQTGDNSPIIQLVRDVVGEAIKKGASDIHIEPGPTAMKFRYRMDGDLVIVRELPMTQHQSVIARVKILSNLKLDEKRKPQDGHFSVEYDNRKIDFRVSSMPSYFGEKIVIRILDNYKGVRDMASLGLLPQHYTLIKECLSLPYGIVLISGPTGSGKTSTLYSMINALDKEGRNIITLEDPVEFSIAGVSQSQIAPDIGYTFASGLRSILRQDPDVIMVGEIRDKETAELAIQAALTGHLVFSTIHTNSAISTITRLIDMDIESYLIAPTVRLVIAQRLVRRLVPESLAPHNLIPIDGPYQELIQKEFGDLPHEVLENLPFSNAFHAARPTKDYHTGMRGRQAVFEMLKIDNDIERAIVEKKSEDEIYKIARSKGMVTLKEDALLKSMQGEVPFAESMGL
jgi:type II secretory ATPase GspE/PulE/Tfp pilus assembly ATPase PilB-like protein